MQQTHVCIAWLGCTQIAPLCDFAYTYLGYKWETTFQDQENTGGHILPTWCDVRWCQEPCVSIHGWKTPDGCKDSVFDVFWCASWRYTFAQEKKDLKNNCVNELLKKSSEMTVYYVFLNSDMGHLLIHHQVSYSAASPSASPSPPLIDFTDPDYRRNDSDKQHLPPHIQALVDEKVKTYVRYYTLESYKSVTYHVLDPAHSPPLQDKWSYACGADTVVIDYSKLYKYNSLTMVPR